MIKSKVEGFVKITSEFAVVELNAKIRAWEAEKKTRDLVTNEIKTKQEELAKLGEERNKLNEEIQKKRQEASEPMQNKLDYFEQEVRRLEQKLTQ